MSRYNIFDGGNELRHYDDYTSGVNGYDNIRPAAHQLQRQRHVLFHVNTGDRPFTSDWNPLQVENNDEIATHLIGAGWVVTGVAFHVKQAGTGTLHPVVELGDGTLINLASYDAVVEAGKEGSYENTATIDLTKVGYTMLRPVKDVGAGDTATTVREVLNQSGVGYVSTRYKAAAVAEGEQALLAGCFGVILELTYLEDERECNCVTVPCPTTFPAPICSPSI